MTLNQFKFILRFFYTPKIYRALSEFKILPLLDPQNIQKFFSVINYSPNDLTQNKNYINFKINSLEFFLD